VSQDAFAATVGCAAVAYGRIWANDGPDASNRKIAASPIALFIVASSLYPIPSRAVDAAGEAPNCASP
jgi:hypothetical protein